jgi:tetratricopeptide (TPR) repeat protein
VQEYNKAKNYFSFGNYDKTIKILRANIKKLENKDDKIEALKLLASSLFFKDKKEESKKEFRELLSLNNEANLDTLVYPPPLIDFFNKIKEEFIKKNNMMKEILEKDKKKIEDSKKEIVIKEVHFKETNEIKITIEKNNYFFSVMPFGYAQYRNNQKSKAYVFLTAESILLASNIVSYILTYNLKDSNNYYVGSNKTKAEVYNTITKYTFISLASFIIYGAIDGLINYQPIFETKITEIKNKPIKISFLNGNFISFKYSF